MREERDKEEEREEVREWLDGFDAYLERHGRSRGERLLRHLERRGIQRGLDHPRGEHRAYLNTIHVDDEPRYGGDLEMEARIEGLVRWNAMAMVVGGNQRLEGIGGHISTYASAATLFEVGFNHFFRGKSHPEGGDQIYFQGHAATGVYARAHLEGRLKDHHLKNFRRELAEEGGLSSYPHPYLMPDFWEFPTVSMGLSPMMAIYQARFNRYLEARELKEHTGRVWAFLGDGEMDEPESIGGLRLAAREKLSNLTFVINCNLQRLDGPVVGNRKIINELEALFLGAGWRVIKVIWGEGWERLLARDRDGLLAARMEELVDGDYQRYAARDGAYLREHFFGVHEELLRLVEDMSDGELRGLLWGGHDPKKVYAAYAAALEEEERPTVILAKTVKGFGLGAAGEARNVTHQAKTLSKEALRNFRDRFKVSISDDDMESASFVGFEAGSPEVRYAQERREVLGGPIPRRRVQAAPLEMPSAKSFERLLEGSGKREATTTVLMVRMLGDLLNDAKVKDFIVPIIPDEARTFGVEALFPKVGIYAPGGQLYEPVDQGALLSYKESAQGQLLEEGISEAGAMSSLIAAGTAYATHGIQAVPFYFFYSMFGFQRIGDFIWAAGDMRTRGFLIGATSGRTTLNGEGLQHQDGHSQLVAMTHPTVRAYDPAYGYELATIVEDGLRKMYVEGQDLLYYVTVVNEAYVHPPMPEGVREGILAGMYRVAASTKSGAVRRAQLLASGTMVEQARRAKALLEEDYGITVDVWSVTSWKALFDEAGDVERSNLRRPGEEQKIPYVRRCLGEGDPGAVVAVSDYIKALPSTLGRWLGPGFVALGTDGYGRSESREALRDFFEVDYRHIALAALSSLARQDRYPASSVEKAIKDFGLDPYKPNPLHG